MEPIEKDILAERILCKWLSITSSIQNERIVNDLTYNEALVCNHLMHQGKLIPDYLTPSELSKRTGIQKSLMNRTLKSLNERNLIEYVEGTSDKRSTPVRLSKTNLNLFLQEHNKNISLVKEFMDFWGPEKTMNVFNSLKDIEDAAKKVLNK